jgi:hypothetical protein
MGVRLWAAASLTILLLTGCMRAGAARAAQLPQPTNIAQWLAIAVIVIGLWWVALKIIGLK